MAGLDPRMLALQAQPVIPREALEQQALMAAVNVSVALLNSPTVKEHADRDENVRKSLEKAGEIVEAWLGNFRITRNDQ